MKQKLLLLLMALAALQPLRTAARDFTYTYEGQTVTYTVIDSVARTCMTKEGTSDTPGNSLTGELILPANPKDGETEFTLVSIGYCAFIYCPNLTSVVIPNSVLSIGESAFDSCLSLASINLPSGLTKIEDKLFWGCNALTSVSIPESVTSIGEVAFNSCRSLTSIEIPNSVTSIGRDAFSWCSSLASVVLSNSLDSIGDQAFAMCEKLEEVSIPETVTFIGEGAFSTCAFSTIKLPPTIKVIEQYTFTNCKNLVSIEIPSSVDSVGLYAFRDCEKLEKVYAPSMESWMGIAFADETANPLYYGAELIINNQSTDVVEIPDETEEVSDYAFAGLKNLVEVVISEAVEKIGNGSFTGTGLENITIPQSVKEIGEKAFQNCKSLISAVIGKITGKLTRAGEVAESELTSVGNEAFAGCESLDRVSIGSNVGSIGELAFAGSGSITRVDVYSLIAPDAADDAFDAEIYAQAELHVPAGYADIFESAPVWSSFSKIVADLDAPGTIIEVSGIELNMPEATIQEEETVQLVATVTPADADDQTVTWSSSNEAVATVDQDGLVTALKAGTATITARTANGLTAKCELTVETKTGIDGVEADAQVSVVARDGVITVTAPEGAEVEVYSMTGMRVAKTREHRIEGLAGGVYIVRVAAKSFKVML